ncbi:hypothetical protein DUNSADRAFT_1504 [Dunaliella salina]|uniref:Protein kinase domain-containing protein n=1 Tax=Dunaliella salina TaxID=3046 RepID=A0ABQ7GWW7_DUNSA|nr:hypothetical protein DUNSADRAFT_1504 [Dunaliella salina]|eukprot:KAF5839106.1 hypothetical protein DUNSADRAFT_1504 [Dunaliella salina]
MGNCLSEQGDRRAQRDESQGKVGKQRPAARQERTCPRHLLKAEVPKQEADADFTQQNHPCKQPRGDSAEDLPVRCSNNANDSACDCSPMPKHLCEGGVHDLAAGPPLCAGEASRIQTFEAYGVDKLFAPCRELDTVLQALCRVVSTPYACFSLYHNKTCSLVNTVGFPGGKLQWNLTACPWNLTVKMPATIACGDLLEDARFADMPWTHQGLRTYVSAPVLASNGERLGSCCFMDNVPWRVDAGMCRLLNNFGEIAVRVLERHISLAVRLEEARQAARLMSSETACMSAPLSEPMKALDSRPVELEQQQQQQQQQQVAKSSSSDKAGSALVVKEGGWLQQLQGAGPEAQAAATAAACQSYGAWWGDEAESAEAASSAAAAAVAEVEGKARQGWSKGGALQQARNPQLQLYNVFQREVRDTTRTADACVLLVDTGHPDWPVIFADETWKEWAGYSRDAILGRGLFELLQPAAPSVAPCRREQLQAEAQAGERFVLHGQVAVPPGTNAADLVRASTAGSLVSLPTLHANALGPGSTQMGQENASDFVLHSVDSNVVLGQPRAGRPSNLDSHSSNATALQRMGTPMSQKEDNSASIEVLHQQLLQQEQGQQCANLSTIAATSPFQHSPTHFLTGIEGAPHAPLPAASPSCQKEQPKSADFLLKTQSSIKSTQPLITGLWNASQSAETLTPAPVNLASNSKYPGSAAVANKSSRSRVFDLSFRPAVLDVLDCDALPLGVPSFVPMETSGRLLSLYMVRLHKRGEEVVQPANKPFEPSAKVTQVGQANPSLLAPRFFPGMRVQQVLGAGGYGTAYQGRWHDTNVVLKVQDYMLSSSKELLEAQLEIILGQLLNHPNLVRTLAHATVELPPNSLVPFSQIKQASQKQKASKARAMHNRRSSAAPRRLSSQDPTPPSHQDTRTTTNTAMRQTPGTGHATQARPDCGAAPSSTADLWDACIRSSAGSHAESGGNAAAKNEERGHGMDRRGRVADDMMRGEEKAADKVKGGGGKDEGSKSREGEVGGQLCDELNEDDNELLNEDPAYWFSNPDACVRRLPAMLTSLGNSLNLDLSNLLDDALTSVASLSRTSFVAGSSAQVPTTVSPNLPTVPSGDSNVALHQESAIETTVEAPSGASGTTMTSPHPSCTDGTVAAASSTEGVTSGRGSSCAASNSAMVSRKTGKPSASSEVQTMVDETEEKRGSGGGAADRANKASPFSAVQGSNPGSVWQRSTSAPSSGESQQKVDSQQGFAPSRTATASAADVISEGGSVHGAQMMPGHGSSVEGPMGAKVEQLLAEAEARTQRQKKQELSFPMCVRTLTMMELCDGGSLLDAIDRGWLRDGPCTKDTPVDIVKVMHVALDIASALEYLHSVGVVHADLSAGNVLLTRLPPGVKRNTGVTSATQSSSSNNVQQQQRQQQQIANSHSSNPAAALPPPGASPFAAAAQSFVPTPMPTVPERVPVSPGVDEDHPGSTNKVPSPPDATSRESGSTASDLGSAPGATGYDFLAAQRGELKADNIDNSTLDHNPALESQRTGGGKFIASPPVRRYQLGSTAPRTARDMQFVAKVCDYGKARLLSPTGIVKAQAYATITHMAPEVLTDLLLSPAADMYAFGVLLWQMVCCSRPWPMMSHQQIFAVVSCNAAQLPWPNTAPLNRPPGTQAHQASSSTTSGGGTGKSAPNAEAGGASGAAQGPGDSQPVNASSDVPVLGGAPAEVAAATGACTTVPPELVELGKACLSHNRLSRPSAATAVATLRSLLARLEAA